MAADWTENSRALKLLVIGMTVLLVLGLIALLFGMARTASKLGANIGDVAVEIPQDATLVGVSNADGRLFIALRRSDGSQEILVRDAKTGKAVGRYDLVPQP